VLSVPKARKFLNAIVELLSVIQPSRKYFPYGSGINYCNFFHMKLKQNIAVSESGFVFNPAVGDSFTTNPIGVNILQLLKEGKTAKQIVLRITASYEVDNHTCEKDVYDYLNMLKQYCLVD